MAGKLLTFWNGICSDAMFVFGRVESRTIDRIFLYSRHTSWSDPQESDHQNTFKDLIIIFTPPKNSKFPKRWNTYVHHLKHLTGQLLKRIGVACSLQVFRAIEATFAYQPRIHSQGDWEDDFPFPKVGYVSIPWRVFVTFTLPNETCRMHEVLAQSGQKWRSSNKQIILSYLLNKGGCGWASDMETTLNL